jgi:hypothetical protein
MAALALRLTSLPVTLTFADVVLQLCVAGLLYAVLIAWVVRMLDGELRLGVFGRRRLYLLATCAAGAWLIVGSANDGRSAVNIVAILIAFMMGVVFYVFRRELAREVVTEFVSRAHPNRRS